MAFGMRYWSAAVVTGAAASAIWLLPPAGFGPGLSGGIETVEQRSTVLAAELSVAHGALQRLRWADSLPALAVQTAQEGLVTGFPPHQDLPDEGRQAFREYVQREVDALDRRDPSITLGYFYQPAQHAGLPELTDQHLPGSGRRLKETYVGEYEGQPYCLQVRVVDGTGFASRLSQDLASWEASRRTNTSRRSNFLSGCRLHARFGLAGPEVQEWLDAGAIGFASLQPVNALSGLPWWRNRRNLEFWLARGSASSSSLAIKKCMAGQHDPCLALITEPEFLGLDNEEQRIVDRSPATSLGGSTLRSPFGEVDDRLFATLEDEFGADAFGRFWTSDKEVPVAFEEAFGVDLGDWTVSWVRSVLGTVPLGPRVPRQALWLSLLTVSLLAGVAGFWNRRRKVA